jgi:hypothetical protein
VALAGLNSTDDLSAARAEAAGVAQRWRLIGRILLVLAALGLAYYFAAKGTSLVRHYDGIIRTAYEAKGPPVFPDAGDVTVFYTAGRVAAGHPSGLYNERYFIPQVFQTQGWPKNDVYAGDGSWSKFYNPPFFALILSPLTLLEVHTAYLVVLGINVFAGILLIYLMGRILGWQQPATLLLPLGLFSFTPLYFVFQHAQPSLLLAVLLAASFLFMESGAYRPASLMLVFAGLKPQWLAMPTLVLVQRDRRALIWFAGAGVLIIGLPFLLVGWSGIQDYFRIVLDRGSGDISNQEFSSAILSWSGFVRALTGQPQPLLWGLMALVTLAVFLFVCVNGDSRLSTSASIIATLLVIPHSHPQDWVVIAVAGAIALGRKAPFVSHLVTAACLLAIYFAANDWPRESLEVSLGHRTAYWITPASALLLAWFGLVPLVESRIAAAAAPSIWRLEWESVQAFKVKPWQAAGFTFSVGIVLGVSLALALVKEPHPVRLASSSNVPVPAAASVTGAPVDARFPSAEVVQTLGASASAGWAFGGPETSDSAFPMLPGRAALAGASGGTASGFVQAPPTSQGSQTSVATGAEVQEVLSASQGQGDTPEPTLSDSFAKGSGRAQSGDLDVTQSEGDAFVAGESPLADRGELPRQLAATAGGLGSSDSPAFESSLSRFRTLVAVAGRAFQPATTFAGSSAGAMVELSRTFTPGGTLSRLGLIASRLTLAVQEGRDTASHVIRQQSGLLDGTAAGEADSSIPSPEFASVVVAEAVSDVTITGVRRSLSTNSLSATLNLRQALNEAGFMVSGAAAIGGPILVTVPSQTSSRTGAPAEAGNVSAGADNLAPDGDLSRSVSNVGVSGIAIIVARAKEVSAGAGSLGGLVAATHVQATTGAVSATLSGLRSNLNSIRSLSSSVASIGSARSGKTSATQDQQLRATGLSSAVISIGRHVGVLGSRMNAPNPLAASRAVDAIFLGTGLNVSSVQVVRTRAYIGTELQYQARLAGASATSTALAVRPSPAPTSTPLAERTNCEEIRATGARTPMETQLLETTCAPTPVPPTPQPEANVAPPPPPAPAAPPPPPAPPARCTRVSVVGTPKVAPLPDGGFRIDAEVAPSEPAGCVEWPAAFSASASISVNGGSAPYQGTWSCDAGRNPTAGVSASTHFAFFCTIGVKAGPPSGSFFTITVSALSDAGAVLTTTNQSFPPPSP